MKKRALLLAVLPLIQACQESKPEEKPAVYEGAKRVVRLTPTETRWIELDDGSRYGMGDNVYRRLVTRLNESGKFVVVVNENTTASVARSLVATTATPANENNQPDPSDRLRFDFAPLPAADFSAEITGLDFTHGSRGNRRYAGFTPEFRTPFNSGGLDSVNEFTPRSLDFVSGWFGTSFDAIGQDPNSTISGVDFGEEGEFSVIAASVNYRRDTYRASAKVKAQFHLLAENSEIHRQIDATGTGFLLAVGVGYQSLSAEFGLARRTALKDTFDNAVDKIAAEIEARLFTLPLRSRIEKTGKEGIILNAGRREGVKVGDVFLHRAGGAITRLSVTETFRIGSVLKAEGTTADLRAGDVVTLESAGTKVASVATKSAAKTATAASASDESQPLPDNREIQAPAAPKMELASIVIEPPVLEPNGNLTKGLNAKALLLPLLAARYLQYDQALDANPKLAAPGDFAAAANARWNLKATGVAAAWARGLTGRGVAVAVIDSGVDYNHKNLAHVFTRNYAGHDFLSGDVRPFDDNSHGTALAGIIAGQAVEKNQAGLAPGAQLFAYKAFDPWGQTTSAALYGAFERAINDGAKVILCGWDTRKESAALEKAVRLAESHGVLVITAAGDKGADLRAIAHYPAAYNRLPNVISVTAINEAGGLVTESGRYANYGAGAVDLAAPGGAMEVAAPRSNYLTRTGSDLAAAHVAAVAALVWQRNPGFDAARVKDQLLRSATPNAALAEAVTEGRVLNADAATR